jgi:hypothetical protein
MFEGLVAEVQMLVLLSFVIFFAGIWLTMLVYVFLRHVERKSGRRRRSSYRRY